MNWKQIQLVLIFQLRIFLKRVLSKKIFELPVIYNVIQNLLALFYHSKSKSTKTKLHYGSTTKDLEVFVVWFNVICNLTHAEQLPTLKKSIVKSMMINLVKNCFPFRFLSCVSIYLTFQYSLNHLVDETLRIFNTEEFFRFISLKMFFFWFEWLMFVMKMLKKYQSNLSFVFIHICSVSSLNIAKHLLSKQQKFMFVVEPLNVI